MLFFAEIVDVTGEHLLLDSERPIGGEYPVVYGNPYTSLGLWREGAPVAPSFDVLLFRMFTAIANGLTAYFWEGEVPLISHNFDS